MAHHVLRACQQRGQYDGLECAGGRLSPQQYAPKQQLFADDRNQDDEHHAEGAGAGDYNAVRERDDGGRDASRCRSFHREGPLIPASRYQPKTEYTTTQRRHRERPVQALGRLSRHLHLIPLHRRLQRLRRWAQHTPDRRRRESRLARGRGPNAVATIR